MKKSVYFSLAILLIVLVSSFKLPKTSHENNTHYTIVSKDIDGKALFNANGCSACHNLTVKTVGPSVIEIAKSYDNNKVGLIKFLNGEAKAIVDPAQYPIMKTQLSITKKMSNEEKEALAKFMLTAK